MRDCEGFPKQDLHANLPVTKSVLDLSEAPDRELTAGRGNLILFCFHNINLVNKNVEVNVVSDTHKIDLI